MGRGHRRTISALLLIAAALCGAALVVGTPADASDPLANPGFETWTQTMPSSWTFAGVGFSKAAGEGNPGNAVRVTLSGGTPVLSHAAVPVEPGSTVEGSMEVSGDAEASVQLRLVYLNGELGPVATHLGTLAPVPPSFSPVFMSDVAPAGSEFVQIALAVSGPSGTEVLIDNAALDITAPQPTPIPSPTSTSTPTPETAETATPTPTLEPGATSQPSATAGGGSGNPTKTPTSTRTPTPTKTPTGTRSPSPTNEPTSTKTPTPPKGAGATAKPTSPLATSTPTVQPGSGFGGFLANGDFELVVDGKPAYWEKFGGVMTSDGESARGTYAACLQSETASTKWLYQVVGVEPGAWYAASATGRVSGAGAVSIRVSWYTSSDGSGSQMDQAESNVSSSSSWTSLGTGSIQAPDGANSARVRLVLRPDGPATACFDDASFLGSDAPPDAPEPTVTPGSPNSTGSAQPGSTRSPAASTTTVRPVGPRASGTAVPLLTFPAGGPGALRISEFMSDPDPSGRDAPFEWVELVNVSAEPVSLEGWKLGDSSKLEVLTAFTVPAQGYVVVAGASAEFPPDIAVVRAAGGEIGNGLGNDGDYIVLVAPNDEIADEMSYGANTKVFDPPPPAPAKGGTLGTRQPAADPASENWALTSRPTPGEPNAFPANRSATVGSERTAAADAAAPQAAAALETDRPRGSPGLAWIILILIAIVSAGGTAVKFGPSLEERLKGLKSRLH